MNFAGTINSQDRLLTLNRNSAGEVKDVLPGVHVTPCFLDAENGVWVLYARFDAGTILPKHFHTGSVHFYTTAGSWAYVEYPEDVQTAGSYLFEPGGSIHTFQSKDGAEGFMVVNGANINFADDGSFMNIMDAGWIEETILSVAKQTGQKVPRYICPGGSAKFAEQ
ncbi:2,4'-dihydroxyacetophenone dioxygenase family protein [Tsuneonella mangrovi]|uniref:2,4'-dihydroxyacetophenone dioxygenase family protein n=1 Tax=Tsuneonella mangrovi TaxID=1982042 RepID=UPI000BA29352|nr:2,4'-dihydroxyacetophenone dioxygenase family protein [Tsuneonella mangrovi]